MVIKIFHSVRLNTDQILMESWLSMYSKTNVLKKPSFNLIMHMLNILRYGDVNIKLWTAISR